MPVMLAIRKALSAAQLRRVASVRPGCLLSGSVRRYADNGGAGESSIKGLFLKCATPHSHRQQGCGASAWRRQHTQPGRRQP